MLATARGLCLNVAADKFQEEERTMATPKVDPDLCTGCGICEDICPDVFEVGDDGLSHVIDASACDDDDCCEEAADECPEGAITIE